MQDGLDLIKELKEKTDASQEDAMQRFCLLVLNLNEFCTSTDEFNLTNHNDKMNNNKPKNTFCGQLNRREYLHQMGGGFSSLAMAGLLAKDGFIQSQAVAADGKTPGPIRLHRRIPPCRPRPKMSSSFSCTVARVIWTPLSTSRSCIRWTVRRLR